MKLSAEAQKIHAQINTPSTKMGDVKHIAKTVKVNHALALELWSTGDYFPRLLAVLIMDKKLLTQAFIDLLDNDLQKHTFEEKNHIMEWLMANQLTKDKKTIALIESWENSPSALQRRTYWYYQARLRWMGQTPPGSEELLSKIEEKIEKEPPEVQWAMNFTAAWIGIYEKMYRNRCIALGEKTGLYKGQMVSKGCTPDYLPEFITIESNKRNL